MVGRGVIAAVGIKGWAGSAVMAPPESARCGRGPVRPDHPTRALPPHASSTAVAPLHRAGRSLLASDARRCDANISMAPERVGEMARGRARRPDLGAGSPQEGCGDKAPRELQAGIAKWLQRTALAQSVQKS